MRDIDKRTRTCVDYFESGCFGNTMVSVRDLMNYYGPDGEEVNVYLHANFIYKRVRHLNGRQEEIFTLAGWNTPTTRRRLNAILMGCGVTTIGRRPWVRTNDGVFHAIDDNKYYKHEPEGWSVSDSEYGKYAPLEWSVA